MDANGTRTNIVSAVNDFHDAHRRAALESLLARITGKSAELLSYDEVRKKLSAIEGASRLLRDIPVDAIVGSVGRYTDFSRTFLPRRASDQDRWANVKRAVDDLRGLDPIEVYQVGEVYFVIDGNHRVSVARNMGASHIQAYVIPVFTRVPLEVNDSPDDLIIKAEYTEFLEKTHFDELCPGQDLIVTIPGQYQKLLEHISVHRYFMGIDFHRPIEYPEAVSHWFKAVYQPIITIIRQRNLLREFPNRTETDLYLWLMEYRVTLQDELGWEISPAAAANTLASRFSAQPRRIYHRLMNHLFDWLTPDELEGGPPPGEWRREWQREQLSPRREGRLFEEILVTVPGDESGWHTVDLAIQIAQKDEAVLAGLHVVPQPSLAQSETVEAIRAEFLRRCAAGGISGRLAVESGGIARKIIDRSQYVDLVITRLAFPPPSQPIARLRSGLHVMIQRCAKPILVVPPGTGQLTKGLLAYDGSPKAREALYVATVFCERWKAPLVVVAGQTEKDPYSSHVLAEARRYLEEHHILAEYVLEHGRPGDVILRAAEKHACDLILMGGYGTSPMIDLVVGSTVDSILKAEKYPVFICR